MKISQSTWALLCAAFLMHLGCAHHETTRNTISQNVTDVEPAGEPRSVTADELVNVLGVSFAPSLDPGRAHCVQLYDVVVSENIEVVKEPVALAADFIGAGILGGFGTAFIVDPESVDSETGERTSLLAPGIGLVVGSVVYLANAARVLSTSGTEVETRERVERRWRNSDGCESVDLGVEAPSPRPSVDTPETTDKSIDVTQSTEDGEAENSDEPPAVVSVEQAAEYLKVAPEDVRAWIESGDLPAVQVGDNHRISMIELHKAWKKLGEGELLDGQ